MKKIRQNAPRGVDPRLIAALMKLVSIERIEANSGSIKNGNKI